jgi:hypothetical protein
LATSVFPSMRTVIELEVMMAGIVTLFSFRSLLDELRDAVPSSR